MKCKVIGFRLEAMSEEKAFLDIFDEIGEFEDFDGEVTGFGPKKLAKQLDECTAKKIEVRINSNGGDLYQGIAIHNLLQDCGKEVTTTVVGLAASAASIIAMAGSSVRMHPTSQMMVHNCWTIAFGNSSDLRKVADEMDKAMESAKQAYLIKSGGKLSEKKLDELLAAESYLTADECKKLGLCDVVVGKDEDPDKEKEKEREEEPEEVTETETDPGETPAEEPDQETPNPDEDPDEEEEKKKQNRRQPNFKTDRHKKTWFF